MNLPVPSAGIALQSLPGAGRSIRFLLLVFAAVSLAGCSWIMGGKSNLDPPAELGDFASPLKVSEVWSRDAGKGAKGRFIRLVPHIADDVIYVSDTLGRLHAYDKHSGKVLWKSKLDVSVTAGVGYGAGMVLVGTGKGEVIALDKTNGKRAWINELSSEILAPPVVEGAVVVAQTVDGKIAGLSTESGARLWLQERSEPTLGLRGTSTPLALGGVVLIGFASGKIAAFQMTDGRMLWEIPIAESHGRSEIERIVDVDVQPVVLGKLMYAAAYQGKLVAFNLESGRIVWSREVSTYSGMDVDDAAIYLTDEKGNVLGLDLATGASLWQQDKLHGRALTAPTVMGKYLVVADFEGYVHWLARDDGRFVARHRPSRAAVLARPLVDGDTLYVSSQNGTLSALRLTP